METEYFSVSFRELHSSGRSFLPIWRKYLTSRCCEQVINIDVLTELLVQQSNLYSQQNGRKFLPNTKEMKSFIGVTYIMAVNQLPSIPMYWDCDHCHCWKLLHLEYLYENKIPRSLTKLPHCWQGKTGQTDRSLFHLQYLYFSLKKHT